MKKQSETKTDIEEIKLLIKKLDKLIKLLEKMTASKGLTSEDLP